MGWTLSSGLIINSKGTISDSGSLVQGDVVILAMFDTMFEIFKHVFFWRRFEPFNKIYKNILYSFRSAIEPYKRLKAPAASTFTHILAVFPKPKPYTAINELDTLSMCWFFFAFWLKYGQDIQLLSLWLGDWTRLRKVCWENHLETDLFILYL